MEHTVVLGGAQGHRDGSPDVLVPAEGAPGQPQGDEVPWAQTLWDAWDDAPRDAAADAAHLLPPVLVDADAGKSAVLALGGLVQDASFLQGR